MQSTLPSRDLVLIGAGHTNLHVVRMWRMQPIPDVELTVVSPFSRATYSGMLPGTLAGLYEPVDMEIDLFRFTSSCGARLIVAEAIGFDPHSRRIYFADRPPIRYDVASIGIGSVPSAGELWRTHVDMLSIKPMATFLRRFESRLQQLRRRDPQAVAAVEVASTLGANHTGLPGVDPDVGTEMVSSHRPQICVVGAGAAGVEVTFCLNALLQRRGAVAGLSLIDSGDTLLPGFAEKTIRLARDEFARRGISICLNDAVVGYENGRLAFESGRTRDADLVIWATGAAPPPVLREFQLPKTEDGFLAVQQTLQTTANHRVFVVGDTATLVDHPLPKAGVYAVREGPVLWENIKRILQDRQLLEYEPQKGFLSLISTGDGRAIAQYKGFSAHGTWVWKWKDSIDRKFMRKYQDYRPMTADMMAQRAAQKQQGKQAIPKMRCRGCGGKVGANVLATALERLDVSANAHALQGLDRPDDAALLDPKAGAADVLSVDFFQAFLDDPYLVGRVAALNALSDLWAMGSVPVAAMAMVTLPEGPHRQQAELLYQLLAGGLRELAAADATLLGGHTTESSELTIGYSVLGKLNGKKPLTKANLKHSDRLVLTKPLGTGVLLAAHSESDCSALWMDEMLESMLLSSAAAAHIARECRVSGVTDVTGFGLAGHLLEMLEASGVSARISLQTLPLLAGFRELSGQGVRSSLDPANRESEDRIRLESPGLGDDDAYNALFDPQTSGGLLIGASPETVDELLDGLCEVGYKEASIVGEVCAESESPVLTVTH